MAANTTPIFTLTPNCPVVTMSTANTARDGSGSLTTLFTAGSNGSLLSKITFTQSATAVGASTACVCRIFVTDTSGANPTLRGEVAVAAVTSSNSAIGATGTFTFTDGLVLKSGQIVKVTTSVSQNIAVVGEGGDY